MNEKAYREQLYNIPQSDDSLKLRLLTNELLEEIRIYLNGGYTYTRYDKDTGKTSIETVNVGEKKCNERGMQSIMFFLKVHFSQHLVLGNISERQYNNILHRTREEFSKNVMINRIDYGLSLADYSEIMDYLMQSYEIYLTRAIGAGDRKSLSQSHSTVERLSETQPTKRFGLF